MATKEKSNYRSFSFDKRDLPKFEQVKKYYENKTGFEIKSYQVITKLLDEKLKEITTINVEVNNGNE